MDMHGDDLLVLGQVRLRLTKKTCTEGNLRKKKQ